MTRDEFTRLSRDAEFWITLLRQAFYPPTEQLTANTPPTVRSDVDVVRLLLGLLFPPHERPNPKRKNPKRKNPKRWDVSFRLDDHYQTLVAARPLLAAYSPGPVRWASGRDNYPHPQAWPSAHEAVVHIMHRLIAILQGKPHPGHETNDEAERLRVGCERLVEFRRLLALTRDELAELKLGVETEQGRVLHHGRWEQPRQTDPAPNTQRGEVDITRPAAKLLTGWHAICAALDEKYAEREKVKGLNKCMAGPIRWTGGAGSQPFVGLLPLREWWDNLTIGANESVNQAAGRKLSAEAQHNYGRNGTAAPEVDGKVKKRRKDHKA